MTTVTVGNYQYEVDVDNDDICIIFSDNGRMTVKRLDCEGLFCENRVGDIVSLYDHLINTAYELDAENANEDFANGAADYARGSANV